MGPRPTGRGRRVRTKPGRSLGSGRSVTSERLDVLGGCEGTQSREKCKAKSAVSSVVLRAGTYPPSTLTIPTSARKALPFLVFRRFSFGAAPNPLLAKRLAWQQRLQVMT